MCSSRWSSKTQPILHLTHRPMDRNLEKSTKRLIIGSGQTETFLWKEDSDLRMDAILEEGGRSDIFVVNRGHDTGITVTQGA